MTTNEKTALLAYAWRFLAKLEGICELVEFKWVPDRGLYARVMSPTANDDTSYPLVIQLNATGKNEQYAELRLGDKAIEIRSPYEIERLAVLSSEKKFWQAIKSKAA